MTSFFNIFPLKTPKVYPTDNNSDDDSFPKTVKLDMPRPNFNQLIDEYFAKANKQQPQVRKIIGKYTELERYHQENYNNTNKNIIPIFYDETQDEPYLVDEHNLVLDRKTPLSDKYMNDLIRKANNLSYEHTDIQPSIDEFIKLQKLLQNIYGIDDEQNGGKIKRRTVRKNKNKNHRKMNKKSRKARRSRNKRR